MRSTSLLLDIIDRTFPRLCFQILERQGLTVLFNVRVRKYPDGREMITYASRAIFNPHLDDEDNDILNVDDVINDEVDFETKRNIFKSDNSMRAVVRARQRIFDIAFLNEWKYFVTMTFDPKNVDHHNPRVCRDFLANWLKHTIYKYRLDHPDFKYLFVPEYGSKNKMIHIHGLISDFPVVDSGTVICKGYSSPIKKGRVPFDAEVLYPVFNLPLWNGGFSTAIPIYKNDGALSSYFTKYMVKDQKLIFGKYYWSSQNLTRDPVIEYYNYPFDEVDLPVYNLYSARLSLKYVSKITFNP